MFSLGLQLKRLVQLKKKRGSHENVEMHASLDFRQVTDTDESKA